MKATAVFVLAMLATAFAFECKQCMHMATDNDDVNEMLDGAMSGAMEGSPIAYSADCKNDATKIPSSECPTNTGCVAMKINALYAAGENKMNMQMYMRMCSDGQMENGCNDIDEYGDKIRESMGPSAGMMEDMSGAICVCAGSNCNVQNGASIKVGGGGGNVGGGDSESSAAALASVTSTLFSLLLVSLVARLF